MDGWVEGKHGGRHGEAGPVPWCPCTESGSWLQAILGQGLVAQLEELGSSWRGGSVPHHLPPICLLSWCSESSTLFLPPAHISLIVLEGQEES